MKAWFQEGAPVAARAATGKDRVIGAIDMAVIRDTEGQDGFAFGKTENVSLFKAFWGGMGFILCLSSLLAGDLIGVVVSIIGLLFLSYKCFC
ncbi:hypothetical protein [Bartonella machadoae]|uniref:hypothetical protein n=1 Tax=Bartonella machadoae TaxID=2893471 RepID=UPI001F4C8F19|nr:hypothetical protein [Bartonella machadoae]UNE53595.1 hypothetical protein LNM86_08040 [Bartonella machadoae]